MLPLAITMGCPAGIGPEIILKYFSDPSLSSRPPAIVVGDATTLRYYAERLRINIQIVPWQAGDTIQTACNYLSLLETSSLSLDAIQPGRPGKATALAMADAIIKAVHGIQQSFFSALCTCPISKEALQESGHCFPGHTEMLAELTSSDNPVMMMAGKTLRVTLATIHCGIADVPGLLGKELLIRLFQTTYNSLQLDFGLLKPKIAVAALNPHASENGMFGDEEEKMIIPAVNKANEMGMDLQGPFPPDTIFVKAAQGEYDCVICMYHDQGLIPFKLLHFADGVNVTLGLPIVRTSVDHGTAYDIAGTGVADIKSLVAAAELAYTIAGNRNKNKNAAAHLG